jgi:single-stranded DNA-binding protein
MNSVHLIGRLATDVEVKEVNGGSKVSSFILAVDRNAEDAGFRRTKESLPRCGDDE